MINNKFFRRVCELFISMSDNHDGPEAAPVGVKCVPNFLFRHLGIWFQDRYFATQAVLELRQS